MIQTHAITAGVTAFVVAISVWVVQGWRYDSIVSDMENKRTEALREAEAHARKVENELQATAANNLKEREREIRKINARHAAVVNSLRNRPSSVDPKVSADSGTAADAEWCTGARLYRDHAAAFAGEAARAAELQAALNFCTTQYNDVKQKLNGEKQ